MTTELNKDAEALQKAFGDAVSSVSEFRGETTVVVSLEKLKEVLKSCHSEHGYDFLLDITTVDNADEDPRFEVVYELSDVKDTKHLRVKAPVSEDEEVPSAVEIWRGADWHEREAYDMMGIRFTDHPDMRRILMWEGYPFYPLRKEFPLAGKTTDMPDVAFTGVAPLEGGPFVTSSGAGSRVEMEPRAKGQNPGEIERGKVAPSDQR